jgi:hypothetical protein
MAQKAPFVLEAADKNAGRPATFIFLHGFGDEAEGLPLGMLPIRAEFEMQEECNLGDILARFQ